VVRLGKVDLLTTWCLVKHGRSTDAEAKRCAAARARFGVGALKFTAAVSAARPAPAGSHQGQEGEDDQGRTGQRMDEHATKRSKKHPTQGDDVFSAWRNLWGVCIGVGSGDFMATRLADGNGIAGKSIRPVTNRAWHRYGCGHEEW